MSRLGRRNLSSCEFKNASCTARVSQITVLTDNTLNQLLACALGAISCPWDVADLENYDRIKPSRERLSLANEYFSAGQKRLGALLTQSSIIAVQCIFMAGLFLMHQQKPVAGWRLLNVASIACRTYISKRMARESRNGQASRSRSMEQRLCWSCFKTER